MLIEEILDYNELHDTSAYNLVEIIVERNDSKAWDSRSTCRSSLMADEKTAIREIRRQIHSYDIEEDDRKKHLIQEKEQVQMLISMMHNLQEDCSYDECMYQVYKHFRKWSSEQSFSRCDYVLKYVSIDDFDIHILISLLMASFPLRSRLSYRSVFYEKVLTKARITYSSEEIQKIFGGLK